MLAFGDCRLDLERRELRRGGAPIDLEPKAFDLLAYLVRHRDRVVSKDDLLEAVWDGRIVSEGALTTRINAVRRALGDDGKAQLLVRTFTRKGVRFVGEVSELQDPAAASPPASSPPAASDMPAIAVLPFHNLTGDPEQQYFVDGVVEEITLAITRVPWLFVIARNPGFVHMSRAENARQAARELGAHYVLEGSVRKSGRRVRIAGQLIDTATDRHIWADRFDGALDDIFALQDQVAGGVAGAIEPELRLAEIARASRRPAANLDAYDLYLRAQAEAYKRTRESLAQSVALARRALSYDPAYAPAMARLALSQMMRRNRHWIGASGADAEEGVRMARQAVAAGGDDPWVLDFAGLALSQLAGDNDAALSALDRALVLNPSFALAFGHRALVLADLGRPQEAILSAHEAIRLSPRDPGMFSFCASLALAHLTLGQYEEGLRWAEASLRENSGAPALRLKLALCGHLGRHEEADECLRRLREAGSEPTIRELARDLPKGLAAAVAALCVQGLRKAGVPEE